MGLDPNGAGRMATLDLTSLPRKSNTIDVEAVSAEALPDFRLADQRVEDFVESVPALFETGPEVGFGTGAITVLLTMFVGVLEELPAAEFGPEVCLRLLRAVERVVFCAGDDVGEMVGGEGSTE